MATQKSKRKRRNRAGPPRAVPSQRREQRAPSPVAHARPQRSARGPAGTYGERPPSPFGGLPVSEIAIFVGAIGVIVGLIQGGGPALIVGVIVCTLGVLEVTAREHFSGYRSHTMLLSAMPAVGAEVGVVAAFGEPSTRGLLLLVVVPVYAAMFWVLRKRFQASRQARVARRES